MQSTGEYMRVQMSPYIHQEYMRVTNNVDGLGFEERKVTAKGKGELTTSRTQDAQLQPMQLQ